MTETEGFAEIIPGTLAATGGWLDVAARPISWIPPAGRGLLPVQGYILRDGGSWLMVDTGLAVHWPLVAEGIRRMLEGTTERRLITTRREQDCMINLPAVLGEFGVREVLYAGVLNPLDFFEGVEERDAVARIEATPGLRATRIAPGAITAIGSLRLEVLRVELRLLATNWFYETETATLFTSDAFAFLARPAQAWSPGLSRLRDPDEAPIRAEDAALYLSAKMDWLIGIDPAPVLADLDVIQAARPIARLCPGFGLVIEGEAAVREAFEAVREALRILGARPRKAWRFPDALREEAAA
ncbi:hypothetical protein D9599_02315 [Roseomonas sp. KE2513]|uniref:hypothetical protein n=1 Tax=Roseomonas sp. KE2513 TaxID=2479202 RepID=UPI0018DFCA49|nr:hypothetical protein [Roseomonas sp. KE2513]MBI0534403.1 hypothetical protein [Roseomonas sp. KE2513]